MFKFKVINQVKTFTGGTGNQSSFSTFKKGEYLASPTNTNYPIIPKSPILLPIGHLAPHKDWGRLQLETKQWVLDLADRSMVNEDTRTTLNKQIEHRLYETGINYSIFIDAGMNNTERIFNLSKMIVAVCMYDDFIVDHPESSLQQQVFDFVVEMQTDDWTHDQSLDYRRPFWLNLIADSLLSFRKGGVTRNQERRHLTGLENYLTVSLKRLDMKDKQLDYRHRVEEYAELRYPDGYNELLDIPLEALAGIDMHSDLLKQPELTELYQCYQLVIGLYNDMMSYFREKAADDLDLNYVGIVGRQFGVDEQEAVERTCEHMLNIHKKFVDKRKILLMSPLAREFPEVRLWLNYVLPQTCYGIIVAMNFCARNRTDYNQPGFEGSDNTSKHRYWVDDTVYVNQTDKSNAGIEFQWPFKRIALDNYKFIERW